MRRFLGFLLLCILVAGCRKTPEKTRLVLAATTSLEDTGLLDTLAAEFQRTHRDIDLASIAVGTGQALELGRRGDADVIVSHDSAAEVKLIADGIAVERRSVMYNDFVVAGPAEDPAHIRGTNVVQAFITIMEMRSPFVSRGDDSGTHRRELAIWREAARDPKQDPQYIEAAVGMGDALLLAGQKRSYILTDRATFLRFKPRVQLEILVEKDPLLLNRYGVTVIKGSREKEARRFADWITSPQVQQLIGNFGRKELGQSLFIPSAHGAAPHDTIPTGER